MDTGSGRLRAEMKPVIPEVCDRLNCKIKICYGWDLCRQARVEVTHAEYARLMSEMLREAEG